MASRYGCTERAPAKVDYIRMSLSDLTTPKGGRIVMTDRWWVVTEDEHVLFYRSYGSPQCNSNKAITERLAPSAGGKPVFVPVAYVPHNCRDYC